MPIPVTGAVAEGFGALSRGQWEQARNRFERQLSERESPEAHEGLSWAAWWLNDAELALASRECAYRMYRAQGQPADAARMAIWLASDYLEFRGELSVGDGWRARARRLLEDLDVDVPEHGWLALHEGALAIELHDDTQAAKNHARRVSEVGTSLGIIDLEVLALALQGLAEVSEGRVTLGMGLLDEAGVAATSGELDNPISVGWACCYLIYACERVRDYARAEQWCDKMEVLSQRLRTHYWAPVCRTHYAVVLTWRGDYSRAETELTRASEALLGSVRPPAAAEAVVRLAELRRRQGHIEQASQMFEDVAPHPMATLGIAEIFLSQGRTEDAIDELERGLRRTPTDNVTQRAPYLETLVRARLAHGDDAGAQAILEELRRIAETVDTDPVRAGARLAEGLLHLRTDPNQSRVDLEDAVDLYERSGAPYEASLARTELVGALVALNRTEAAEREARRAQQTLELIGAKAEARRAAELMSRIAVAARLRGAQTGGLGVLTARQREVLRLVAEGLTDRDIASRLVLSEHTVHRHVANILQKLALPNRSAAVAYASRHGLLEGTP